VKATELSPSTIDQPTVLLEEESKDPGAGNASETQHTLFGDKPPPLLARTQQTNSQEHTNEDEFENDDDVEDVTPTIRKTELQTVQIVSGIADTQDNLVPIEYDSRWTIRKCFSDISLTHRALPSSNTKNHPYEFQGDSGANCTATDKQEMLWQLQYFPSPLKVKTYDGDANDTGEDRTIDAIGAGILKMVDDHNHVMDFYCLLTPNSTGTVISLDKYMRDNREV
jgi:hypothetical protein